jgi:formate transporter
MDVRPLEKPAAEPQTVTFEAILPPAMALRAEESGVKRASTDPLTLLILSVLGGAFVSFGAMFATTVSAGNIAVSGTGLALSAALPYGIIRLISGLAFSVGLMLIIIGGAELFTGNTIIVMAWANGKVKTGALLSNWCLVFVGNVCGAVATAALAFSTTQYIFGGGSVGLTALNTAQAKASLPFLPAFTLGVMCNALVCLAVWMCFSARTNVDRAIAAVPPVAAFAAAGFEHCIANAYFIPLGMMIKAAAPDSFWTMIGQTPADFPDVTLSRLLTNLLPVTLGNIFGGSVMVAAVYWFIYLRTQPADRDSDAGPRASLIEAGSPPARRSTPGTTSR